MSEKLSRRTILAGAVVLPGLSASAIASAQPDPIFTAIEQHKRATQALLQVLHEKSQAEERWMEEYGAINPSLVLAREAWENHPLCTREAWENHPETAGLPWLPWPFEGKVSQGRQIDRVFADDPETCKNARDKLAALKRKYRTIFNPIEARVCAAHDTEYKMRQQLTTTVPITAAGLGALLKYVQEQEQEDEWGSDFFYDDDRHEFYSSLFQSAALIGGGPQRERAVASSSNRLNLGG